MQYSSIESIFEAFERLRVLVIGDVMIDSYIWGRVERISPEAPVPIVQVQKREKRLGGAANVATNLQSLGAKPILCSVIGEDTDAEDFFQILAEQNLPSEGVLKSPHRITTVKHRIIAGTQHLLRVDSEITKPITLQEEQNLIAQIKKLALGCQVIIFEDYDKGTITPTLIREVIDFANQHNIPTVVDPKKDNFLHYKKATLFKPNLKELKEGLKIDIDAKNPDELYQAVAQLRQLLELKYALLTLSERGVYIDDGQTQFARPAHLRNIADVSGAGDTVVSVAALCVALQLSTPFIAALSNLAGGLVCEFAGVVPVDKQSLLSEAKKNRFFEMYMQSK
ncbi:MAG: bifunctional ADP-heptose synthase [Microscillaceae bacterium]|nr:bifunctional ADP-heptose synthase [Microscillaceae bacterium]MDW8461691.1 bifunctional ADP-heptose synthase [Cytophagales bacterium]